MSTDAGVAIGLADALDALHAELSAALERAGGQEIRFPVSGIEIELQVGVTRAAEAHGGVRFWVLDVGAQRGVNSQTLQTVRLNLGAPVGPDQQPIRVDRATPYRP
jgi:hypothetical protein